MVMRSSPALERALHGRHSACQVRLDRAADRPAGLLRALAACRPPQAGLPARGAGGADLFVCWAEPQRRPGVVDGDLADRLHAMHGQGRGEPVSVCSSVPEAAAFGVADPRQAVCARRRHRLLRRVQIVLAGHEGDHGVGVGGGWRGRTAGSGRPGGGFTTATDCPGLISSLLVRSTLSACTAMRRPQCPAPGEAGPPRRELARKEAAAWSPPDASGPVPAGEEDADPRGRMPQAPEPFTGSSPRPGHRQTGLPNQYVIHPNIYARSGNTHSGYPGLAEDGLEHSPIALVGNQIAEYLLVPRRVHARVLTPRTASYGDDVARRLQGNVTSPECGSRSGIVESGP